MYENMPRRSDTKPSRVARTLCRIETKNKIYFAIHTANVIILLTLSLKNHGNGVSNILYVMCFIFHTLSAV